jgi:hypothetical protein
MCSEAAVQGNNSPSATRSCDQGSRAQAHPPPVVWIGEALPAPKQPKLPSREILDHSRRFIPNTVRPFPSSDSSRAITQLHHSVCPCVPAKLHKLRVHPPIYLALAVLTTHPPQRRAKTKHVGRALPATHCRARRRPVPRYVCLALRPGHAPRLQALRQALAQHGPPSNLVPPTERSATKRCLPRAPFPCIPAAPAQRDPAPIF